MASKSTEVEPEEVTEVDESADLTDPAVVAAIVTPGYVKVKGPSGAVTTVPEGIVEALLASGYKKTK